MPISPNKNFVWGVAYLDYTKLDTLSADVRRLRGVDLKASVPTIRILRKQYRNREYWDEVPLLFNYGFFRIPIITACHYDKLLEIRDSIQAMRNWVLKSHVNPYYPIRIHTVSEADILSLLERAKKLSAYDQEDLHRLSPGDIITLKNYPFENIEATILNIGSKYIRVKIEIGDVPKEMDVSISNVVYSIYEKFDEDLSPTYLEDFPNYQSIPEDGPDLY